MKKLRFKLNKYKIFFLYNYFFFKNSKINFFFSFKENEILNCGDPSIFFWFVNILNNETLLINIIQHNLKRNWLFDRLFNIDKAILIYSIYELLFNKEKYFFKIIISQVVNFTKVYSEENSYKFINGILNSVKNLDFFQLNLEKK